MDECHSVPEIEGCRLFLKVRLYSLKSCRWEHQKIFPVPVEHYQHPPQIRILKPQGAVEKAHVHSKSCTHIHFRSSYGRAACSSLKAALKDRRYPEGNGDYVVWKLDKHMGCRLTEIRR